MDPEMMNNQAVETEEIEVDGTPVVVEKTGETIQVRIPEGLSEEQKEKLRKELEKGHVSKLAGTYYRKLQEINEQRREFEEFRKKDSEPKQPEKKASEQNSQEPLWKFLGLQSQDEVADYAADNPTLYEEKVRDYYTKQVDAVVEARVAKSQAAMTETLQQQILETKIAAAGYDPSEVRAFAKFYDIPFSEKTLSLYVSARADKTNPVFAAQANAQKNAINFIETQHFRMPSSGAVSEEVMENMTPEQLDAYMKAEEARVLGR